MGQISDLAGEIWISSEIYTHTFLPKGGRGVTQLCCDLGKQPPAKQLRVGGAAGSRLGCRLRDKWSPLLMAVRSGRPPFHATDEFYKDVHLAFKSPDL